jgi:hypothetical protein
MNRTRTPIPPKVASALLLANRHACCVCQKIQVQIHHIDEDPSNNEPENLAVLCLDHHDHASMKIGLSKKLRPDEVRSYKKQWEARCATDIQALSRDRARFYATLYKNPPRIRELLQSLTPAELATATKMLRAEIKEDIEHHKQDGGFQWQAVPGDNLLTPHLLNSLRAGELWPSVLPRVGGHPKDPDYPIDLSPPHGMTSFHGFDMYCQLVVRALCIVRPPVALESLWALNDTQLIEQFSGSLVTFRELAIGKSISIPSFADETPLGRVQFRVCRGDRVYRAILPIKNMYVFSDTSALNLQRSKVCGVALLEDAQDKLEKGKKELHIGLKPLIIGMGGLGQSDDGWWIPERGMNGSATL